MSDPQFQYIKLPDGSYGKFAANANDADIHAQISKDFPAQMAAQAAANPFATSQAHPAANMPLAQMTGLDNAMNVIHGAVGAAKSVPNTIAGAAKVRNSIPRPIRALAGDIAPNTPDEAINTLQTKPDGTAEEYGMAAGNIAQMMALPEAEGPLALRALASGVGTGVLNKAQGGDFTTGAAAGAGGTLVGAGLKAVAPKIAQIAMGTNKVERAYGKAPGVSVLDETRGIRPGTIVQQAKDKIASIGGERDAITDAFDNAGGRVSIQPGIDVVDAATSGGIAKNSKGVSLPQLEKVRSNLTVSPPIDSTTGAFTTPGNPNAVSGVSLSPTQSARSAQNLKMGLRDDYVANFDPTMMKGTRKIANQASGAIDGSLDAALGPEYKELNDRMSGLYAVKDAAARRELAPGFFERTAGRMAAHTGAATLGGLGAVTGYREGGAEGALLGGLAGIAGPEMLLSPETQMILARGMYSPSTSAAVRAVPKIALPLFPRTQ